MAKQFWEFAVWILSLLSAATAFSALHVQNFSDLSCKPKGFTVCCLRIFDWINFEGFGMDFEGIQVLSDLNTGLHRNSSVRYMQWTELQPPFTRVALDCTRNPISSVSKVAQFIAWLNMQGKSSGSAPNEGKFEFSIPSRDKIETNRFFDVSTFYHYLFAFWCRRKMILLYFLRCRLPRDQLPRVD